MKYGDKVEVKSGPFAGRYGKIICIFRHVVTVLEPNRVAIQVKEDEVEPAAEVATGD